MKYWYIVRLIQTKKLCHFSSQVLVKCVTWSRIIQVNIVISGMEKTNLVYDRPEQNKIPIFARFQLESGKWHQKIGGF